MRGYQGHALPNGVTRDDQRRGFGRLHYTKVTWFREEGCREAKVYIPCPCPCPESSMRSRKTSRVRLYATVSLPLLRSSHRRCMNDVMLQTAAQETASVTHATEPPPQESKTSLSCHRPNMCPVPCAGDGTGKMARFNRHPHRSRLHRGRGHSPRDRGTADQNIELAFLFNVLPPTPNATSQERPDPHTLLTVWCGR